MKTRFVSLARVVGLALAILALALPVPHGMAAEPLAKDLFGAEKLPAVAKPRSYGFYSKGCFSGGVAIATDGPTWQAMRLSRNRRWGHPTMVRLVEKLSRDAVKGGWPGLLLGDISQPRGGPMLTGHASHQIGLDADIWFTPMPDRRLTPQERETMAATSMIRKGGLYVDDRLWTPAHEKLLKRAASYGEVERILVNAGIKKKLCETVKGDRSWLQKVRPFWGHDYHFHVRIGCQPGSSGCKAQAETAPGDGCDSSLDWWFTKAAKLPDNNADTPKARDKMTMRALPKECMAVLNAPAPESEALVTIGPGGELGSWAEVSVAAAPPPAAAESSEPSDTLPISAFAPTPKSGIPLPRPRPEQ